MSNKTQNMTMEEFIVQLCISGDICYSMSKGLRYFVNLLNAQGITDPIEIANVLGGCETMVKFTWYSNTTMYDEFHVWVRYDIRRNDVSITLDERTFVENNKFDVNNPNLYTTLDNCVSHIIPVPMSIRHIGEWPT